MFDFISENRHHFVYLFIILIALGFYYAVNRLQHNPMGQFFTETGLVTDIHHDKNKTTILIEEENRPIYIHFKKRINNIQLVDQVLIHTNGIILESFPEQTNGHVNKNISRQIIQKIEHQQFQFTTNQILEPTHQYRRFSTLTFNKDDFILYNEQFNLIETIELDDSDTIIVSWGSTKENDKITFNNFIIFDNQLYLIFNITSNNEEKTITTGFITIIKETYDDYHSLINQTTK